MYMYCPLCETNHDVQIIKKPMIIKMYGENIQCDHDFFYCNNKKDTFCNGKMVNDNLAATRTAYLKQKSKSNDSLDRTLYKGITKSSNTWVCGGLIKTVYQFPDHEENKYEIQEMNIGCHVGDHCFVEPDWQSGVDEEVFPETICQYTGFKDKNGRRIYEHDIIVVGRVENHKSIESQYICLFRDGCYICMKLSNGKTDALAYFCSVANTSLTKFNVVGNLHDAQSPQR